MPSFPKPSLGEDIRAEAKKLVDRFTRYTTDLNEEVVRRRRRSGVDVPKTVLRPSYWSAAHGFDPFYVRPRALRIAYAVSKAIRTGRYHPRPAVEYEVPKTDGTKRRVSVFQIADATVSGRVFSSLLAKNVNRFSAYAYAYRRDRTVHDAIQYIAADIRGRARVFVAEYDFAKYFESIDHDSLWRIIRDQQFVITKTEESILRAFLETPALPEGTYDPHSNLKRSRGLPQGTSISLFLANVAAWPLDRALERLGVSFARYADDTLIWSSDYSRICQAADALIEAAGLIGAHVNLAKSDGISILAPSEMKSEMRQKEEVEFVGYSFASSGIAMRESSVARIKRRISHIVYRNLLEQPARGRIVPTRFRPRVDRDYVVMIYQLRRYLYGNLTELALRRFLSKGSPRMHFRGSMAFYPLIDRPGFLEALDGWMQHTVFTTLRKRASLLAESGFTDLPEPHGLSRRALLDFRGKTSAGITLDLRLPSLARMGRLLWRASRTYGANDVAEPRSLRYYSGS